MPVNKQSIGPGGFLELIDTLDGPERNVRVISFTGRGDTGFIPHTQFRAGENVVAVIDVRSGKVVTGSFDTAVPTGGINQTDTGTGGTSPGTFAGKVLFAFTTDTGAIGPY